MPLPQGCAILRLRQALTWRQVTHLLHHRSRWIRKYNCVSAQDRAMSLHVQAPNWGSYNRISNLTHKSTALYKTSPIWGSRKRVSLSVGGPRCTVSPTILAARAKLLLDSRSFAGCVVAVGDALLAAANPRPTGVVVVSVCGAGRARSSRGVPTGKCVTCRKHVPEREPPCI